MAYDGKGKTMDTHKNHSQTFCVVITLVSSMLVAGIVSADQPAESDLTRKDWHERLHWDTSECPLAFADDSESGVKLRKLGGNASLVDVECERWAYQSTHRFYLRKGDALTALDFEQFESPDTNQLERYRSPLVTGVPLLNPPGQSIDILRKYRGAGDCGQFLRYQIIKDAAILKVLRVRECGALPVGKPLSPDKWPLRKPPK